MNGACYPIMFVGPLIPRLDPIPAVESSMISNTLAIHTAHLTELPGRISSGI